MRFRPHRSGSSRLVPALLLLQSTFASAAVPSAEARDVEHRRIAATYEETMDYCRALSGTTRKVCVVEADGKRLVAVAELDAALRPSAARTRAAALAVIEADFSLGLARCEDGPADARGACTQRARAELRSARAAAEMLYGVAPVPVDRPASAPMRRSPAGRR